MYGLHGVIKKGKYKERDYGSHTGGDFEASATHFFSTFNSIGFMMSALQDWIPQTMQ
jgi:hypothetical protein